MPIVPNKPADKAPSGLKVRVTELSISAGVTIGLPGYSAARWDYTERATIETDTGEPPTDLLIDAARKLLHRRVQGHVDKVAEFIDKHKRLPDPGEVP